MSGTNRDIMIADIKALLPMGTLLPSSTTNLIEAGLDSLHVMRLMSQWRKAGIYVTFAQLMEKPTLEAWEIFWEGNKKGKTDISSVTPALLTELNTDDSQPFDLTAVQHAYWIGRRDDQILGGVGCHAYLELTGPYIETVTLQQAWTTLVARHPMLRAQFDEDGSQRCMSRQEIDGDISVSSTFSCHDLRERIANEQQDVLLELRGCLSHRRLKVEQGQVAGLTQTILSDEQQCLHLDIDLLVADVQSLQILLRELAMLCEGQSLLDKPLFNFSHYLEWDKQRKADSIEPHQAYWQERIATMPNGPQLPLVCSPNQVTETQFTRRQYWLSTTQWQQLKNIASHYQVTPAMVLVTAFAEALARFSVDPHFVLNLPLFDRQSDYPHVDHAIADFTNLLLLEFDGRQPAFFAQRVQQIQQQFHTDIAHADYSAINVLRDKGRFQGGEPANAPVVFACNLGLPLLDTIGQRVLGEVSYMISQTPQVWLDHQLYEVDGALWINFDSVDTLFPEGVIDALFEVYTQSLITLSQGKKAWKQSLSLPLPDEQIIARQKANATYLPIVTRTLHQTILMKQESSIAVVDGDNSYSYAVLRQHVLRLAALLRQRGVIHDTPVSVTVPRGVGQVIAVLGILAAGGCYVPISLHQPDTRRQRIKRIAGICHQVTEAELIACHQYEPLQSPVDVEPTQRAYIIFTSGSTGEPKGVEVSHQAACNTIDAVNSRLGVTSTDSLLAVSSLDFDLSVYDIFGVLVAGGTLICVPEAQRRDADAWAQLVARHRITLWNTVPTLLEMLLTSWHCGLGKLPIRCALVSGDWIGLELAPRLESVSGGSSYIMALGGATEAAIWSNALVLDSEIPASWRSIPYGFPLANQYYRVVDSWGRDCPEWVPGEIWIGGESVALGYCSAPALTAERFVSDVGIRWYRTGDIGRYWPDGMLEFLGRQDYQVKVRGHRIELGEVEATLLTMPDLQQAIALTYSEPRQLAAAVVARSPAIDSESIKAALRQCLPDYMIPSSVLILDHFPLTANGKVDRASLVEQLKNVEFVTVREAPIGKRERVVAEHWQAILGVFPSRHDDFFMLGGDSLLATRLVARLRENGLTTEQPLQLLFTMPRLCDFSAGLSVDTCYQEITPILPQPETRYTPFSLNEVQQAYWTGRSQALPLRCGTHYLLEFEGLHVDLVRMASAWNCLVKRHDMLRAKLTENGQQVVLPLVPDVVIEQHLAPNATADEMQDWLQQQFRGQSVHTTDWPLYTLYAVQNDQGLTRLGIIIDYLVLDGFSVRILLDEWARYYADPSLVLPALEMTFRDYVTQVNPSDTECQQAQSWWEAQLNDLPPAPALPLACDPSELEAVQFERRHFHLDPSRWEALKQQAQRHGLTPSSVLLTLYATVIEQWSGGHAQTLNLTLFDRRDVHPQINEVLGDFTTLAAIPFMPCSSIFVDRVRDTQQRLAQVMEYRACSSIWVQREQATRHGLRNAALPVVFTSTLGLGDTLSATTDAGIPTVSDAGATVFDETAKHLLPFPTLVEGGLSETPQVWLDHQLYEYQGCLLLHWDAVESLFVDGVLDAMFTQYTAWIDRLIDQPESWHQPLKKTLPRLQRLQREQANQTAQLIEVRTLHQAAFEQMQQTPDATAVIDAQGELTYGELRYRALQVAGYLQQAGLQRGDAVAVSLSRGADQIIAVLGVLASGGCYVPISPQQPNSRRDRIEQRAGVVQRIDSAFMSASCHADSLSNPRTDISPEQLAYIIFTSGSTGEPKGVEICHQAAVNTVDDINHRFAVKASDRILTVSSLDFDLSVYDIFGLLSVGGSIVTIQDKDTRDAQAWRALIQQHQISLWNSVPVLLEMLLAVHHSQHTPLPIRLAFASGDWVPLDLAQRLHTATENRAELIAMGGATEASIWSNAIKVPSTLPVHWHTIPYGYPLANQMYRVVTPQGDDCPDGVIGELWIGGRGIAQGYRGMPALTAERFIEDRGIRWYRTGDMGRYWSNGCLEFLGRQDHQVKVRGHRIELGEVEAALLQFSDIQQVCVMAVGNPICLAAALVVKSGVAISLDIVRQQLGQKLPDYMVPSVWQVMDTLPLTANGKIDRQTLIMTLQTKQASEVSCEFMSELELQIAAIWQCILGGESLPSCQDDFFMLGGDSLRAAQIIEQIQQQGICITEGLLGQLFSEPTIAGLAAAIERKIATSHYSNGALEEGTL